MFKGFDLTASELHKPSGDIRADMPEFLKKTEAPGNVDLKIPIGQRDIGRETKMKDAGSPIQNKLDGMQREKEVANELNEKYPEEKGYSTIPEATLRNQDGDVVKDPETGEARRIDFVVAKDGKAVDSIEVTSKTADKTEQLAKEERIREAGGNYVKDDNGNLVEIPKEVRTRIERRD